MESNLRRFPGSVNCPGGCPRISKTRARRSKRSLDPASPTGGGGIAKRRPLSLFVRRDAAASSYLSLAKMMMVETIPRKNKATNPSCNHCSDVGFFQLIFEDLVLGQGRFGTPRSRDTAEDLLDGQSPRLEQPFGDVVPISVALAPEP
jgi:hypothetical protein